MITKKYTAFEYAGDVFRGQAAVPGLHRQEGFETPHGYAFVVVSSMVDDQRQAGLAETVLSRIRYYLENEPDDNVIDVARNALIYSSGYVYQKGLKEQEKSARGISALCVLFDRQRVYFARLGRTCLSMFDGKKITPLFSPAAEGTSRDNEPDDADDAAVQYIGEQMHVQPETHDLPLEPVTGDMLVLASGSVCQYLETRAIRRILLDNMPLQSKVSRVLRCAGDESGQQDAALALLHFYNMDKAVHGPLPSGSGPSGQKIQQSQTTGTMAGRNVKQGQPSGKKRIVQTIAFAIVGILVVYMLYDLFIDDPMPPIDIPPVAEQPAAEPDVDVPGDTLAAELEIPPALPDDIRYTVQHGDTWSRIYMNFRVCSWFIRNHPPNSGRFLRDGGLIAGQTIQIPVKYSGDPELNPHYYTEFTAEKVGSGCRNVGREFLETFEEKMRSRFDNP